MATLKTANFNGSNGSHFSIRLDYSLTQNKTANTSTIKYSLYFITDKYGSGYGSAVTGYINGSSIGSCTSIGTNSTILIGTKEEKDIKHNSDGTKSVSYSASMSGPWSGLGSASLSGTLTLPKIDRLAILDESSLPTLITDESTIKFSYSNPAGFKVKPVITITQDSLISIEGDYITTSPYTWNWLTTDTNKKLVYDCVRNSPNATARLKLNTYDSNGNFIGSTMSVSTIPFTLVNCSPTISLTCTEQNTKVKNIVGSKLILLNNVSSLKVVASVSTKKGATATEVLIQGKKVSSPYSTTFVVSGTAGNYKVNASVRDSRQIFITTTSSTYQLVDYRPVSIDYYKFERENPTSSVIKLNAEITYWGITLNGTANAPTISYSTNGSTYTTIPTSAYSIDNTNHTITIYDYEVTSLDYKSQGTYYLKIVDKFTEDKENQIVTKGIATTEKGEHDFQVNGDLFLADRSRQNKTPLNVSGKASKNLFDGVIENGRYDYSTGAKTTNDDNRRNKYPIKVEPSTTYIFSNNGSGVGMNIMFYDENYAFLYYETMDAGKSFTTSSRSHYINFFRGSSDSDKIQLEKDTTITSYEKRFEPTISIRNGNGIFQQINLDYEDLSSTITPGENITINYVEVRRFWKVISIVASITPTASIQPYAIILNVFPNHNRSAYTIACNVTDNATAGGVYLYTNMIQTRASMDSGKNYSFTLTYIVD
jgi:hypothetical protein